MFLQSFQFMRTVSDDLVVCPGCNLPEDEFVAAEGFVGRDGELYCCKHCESGQLCLCNPKRLGGENEAAA